MKIRPLALVLSLTLPLAIPLGVQAQNSQVALNQSAQPTEEIYITAERMARTQMMNAEKHAYDIFNKYNDEKRFHISCSIRELTGTKLEGQVCDAGFKLDALAQHGRDFLDTYRTYMTEIQLDGSSPVQIPVDVLIASQQQAYKEKLQQVAKAHPEFVEAISQYIKARDSYLNKFDK